MVHVGVTVRLCRSLPIASLPVISYLLTGECLVLCAVMAYWRLMMVLSQLRPRYISSV